MKACVIETINNHIIVLKALVGSHNYNLDTPESDKDYKYFVLPTLSDLYNGTFYSSSSEGKDMDYTVHDVRKLTHLLWKANVNFLEVLYSKELVFTEEAGSLKEFLLDNRADLCKMNLPYLYDACVGMSINYWNRIKKATPTSEASIQKHGYAVKCAYQSLRILDFLDRMVRFNFDFEKAACYQDGEAKGFLMTVKLGYRSFDEVEEQHAFFLERAKEHETIFYHSGYQMNGPDTSLRERLIAATSKLVFNSVKNGIIQ